MMSKLLPLAVLTASSLALAACEKGIEAPLDKGVCYHMSTQADGSPKFNVVARDMPNIENCAAQLEGMRLRFLRMGGQTKEMVGSYQGSFIHLKRDGIYRSSKYEGVQYIMLVRSGDGRLIMPGAVQ